jgi:hypothetical protein
VFEKEWLIFFFIFYFLGGGEIFLGGVNIQFMVKIFLKKSKCYKCAMCHPNKKIKKLINILKK